MSLDHLHVDVRGWLERPNAERIEYIRKSKWLEYDRAEAGLEKLEDLLSFPTEDRMPNLLIVGDSANGKTSLIQEFCLRHPEFDNPEGASVIVPVLDVRAMPGSDEGRFYGTVLRRLYAQFNPRDSVEVKYFKTIDLLRLTGTKMLIIDEIHQILAGHLNRHRMFLEAIKNLGNELKIPIVGVGTDAAFHAIQSEPQIGTRFEPFVLPRWKFNREFKELLASFEYVLPLKFPSKLTNRDIATELFSRSEGLIGELARTLQEAAVKAVRSGVEKIDLKLLGKLDRVGPAERKRRGIELL